ncbi:MAG TPA: protein kinase [Kofleriaceae bacterium]|nr:protein kinase [Kofleriaceae bacterium]
MYVPASTASTGFIKFWLFPDDATRYRGAGMWTSSDTTQSDPHHFYKIRQHAVPTGVGRYVIREMSGAGGMGVVYRGYDPELDRDVAIKLVRGSARRSDDARMLREAQAMAKLRHRNVVRIFDVGLAPDGVFLAMELIEGGTLRQWLHRERPSFDVILDKFVAAGRGLTAAHARGIVHRDFKPDNVLLDAGGEVFVADFGLAQLAVHSAAADPNIHLGEADTWTQSGQIVGTPAYMPPEQLRGQDVDARADQFSFCVALWEAVYGRRPFRDPAAHPAELSSAFFAAIDEGPVPPARGGRPRWLASLLTRGLAADPDRRWPTLHTLLEEIEAHRASTARPWRLAGPRMIALAGIGVAVAAVAAWHLTRPAPAPRFHLAPLLSRADLRAARPSPDGRRFALVVGHTLVVHSIDGNEDRVILADGVADAVWPPTWAPDSRHLLVSVEPDVLGPEQPVIVDVDSSDIRSDIIKVPGTGIPTFLSDDEIALTSYRERSIKFFRGRAQVAAEPACPVNGDYALIHSLTGTPDGTMIVETAKGDTHTLVILRRDCGVRATLRAESISSFAMSDGGTIIALMVEDGRRELVELSLDGDVVSRRRISEDVDHVLGRRRRVDYVATRAQKTHLVRVGPGNEKPPVHTVEGEASFSLSPDRDTLAWVEISDRGQEPGRLRRSSLRSGLRDVQTLRDHVLRFAWSPGGERLALLVDDPQGPAIVVTDRDGGHPRPVPLHHLARKAAPVWLNDRRIVAASDDYLAYQWFDLNSGSQGDLMDSQHGGTYWLAVSPLDGTIAVWRNGPPGHTDDRTEHLFLQPLGGKLVPLPVDDAVRHHLSPSWSPSGELFVRAVQTGMVSRVALDTGAVTPVAQLRETPCSTPCEAPLMFPADGDVLAVDVETSLNLWETVRDEQLKPPPPVESTLNL